MIMFMVYSTGAKNISGEYWEHASISPIHQIRSNSSIIAILHHDMYFSLARTYYRYPDNKLAVLASLSLPTEVIKLWRLVDQVAAKSPKGQYKNKSGADQHVYCLESMERDERKNWKEAEPQLVVLELIKEVNLQFRACPPERCPSYV